MHGDAGRTFEEALAAPIWSPLKYKFAWFGKLDDAMISRIANIDIVIFVGWDVAKTTVFSYLSAIATYDSQEIEVRIEHLNSNQTLIRDKDATFSVYVNRIRIMELNVSYLFDRSQINAILIKTLYAIVPAIGHINATVCGGYSDSYERKKEGFSSSYFQQRR